MLQYVLRRFLLMIPTLLGISFLVFALIRTAPGDPALMRFAGGGDSAMEGGVDIEALRQQFRERHLLNANLVRAYLHYLGPFDLSPYGHPWFGGSGERKWGGLLTGDLGPVYLRPQETIGEQLAKRLRVTVPLGMIAVFIAYLVAIPIGILSAVRRGSVFDLFSTVGLFVLYALPTFWTGLMLQLVFGRTGLGLLPVIGLTDREFESFGLWGKLGDLAAHTVLPIACLCYGGMAYLSRQMRVGVIDTIRQDYVRTARAKGLAERVVVLKHVLRNSLIPVLTLLATILPVLVGGSVIVETVFDIPGMGKYAYEALLSREYNIIMATTLFAGVMTMLGILLSDILYAVVDPRIRFS